jgi:DNA polymerase
MQLQAVPRIQARATVVAAAPPETRPTAPAVEKSANQRGAATTGATLVSSAAVTSEADDILIEPQVRAATTLEELRSALGECDRCKLCSGRTNIVFGVGNPHADLMFVGEGPGQDEDEQGVPFVGRAGQLLTRIISNGMGLTRDDVYIANVVKCRPPNNRNPEPDEIVACEPFLQRQIAIVKPRAIVTLGKFATQVLLRERTPISKLRGRWHEYRGVPVMPTFHPAYLLRTPSDKRVVWGDIQLVMERLGLPLPGREQP